MFLLISGFLLHELHISRHRENKRIEKKQTIFVEIFKFDISLIGYFRYVGFVLIIAQLISVRYFFNNYLGDLDILGLVIGLFWIFYIYIPSIYAHERDFLFIFLNFLYFILAFPSLFESTSLATESYFMAKANWIETLITRPLVNILTLLGYYSFAEGNEIYYVNQDSPTLNSVWIAPMCTGIFSIQIFVSALISYLLVINGRLDSESLFLALLGIIISYFANLLRLTIVILAGHYYGNEALYWTHQNLGWIIFTIWMLLFWLLLDLIFTRNNNVVENRDKL